MSYIYGAASKARNLTSYIYGQDCLHYTVFQWHTKLAGKSQLSFLISAGKDTPDWESCEDILQRTAESAM
jgi:hypothetical protein